MLASDGSRIGRTLFPLLLLLFPIFADAAYLRCASQGCPAPAAFANARAPFVAAPIQLNFPFPLDGDGGFDFSGFTLGIVEEEGTTSEETPAEEPAATSSGSSSAPSSSARQSTQSAQIAAPPRPVVNSNGGGNNQPVARFYRSWVVPEGRRSWETHPKAGGTGSASTFNIGPTAPLAPGGQAGSAVPNTPSNSQGNIGQAPAVAPSPAPPPPPPHGAGQPGTQAPGQPGEVAGFIG